MRISLVVLATALLTVVTVQQASATNFSGASGAYSCYAGDVNMGDNDLHGFNYQSIETETANAVVYARVHEFDPTDIDTTYDSSPDSNTDVYIWDADYANVDPPTCGQDWYDSSNTGVIGLYTCQELTAGDRCQCANLRFSTAYIDDASTWEERSLTCHEIGHSVGLRHRSEDGCMDTGAAPSYLSSHDSAHLNASY